MPELPEVEIMTRNVRAWTKGRRIARFELLDPNALVAGLPPAPGVAVRAVWRRGKHLVWEAGEGAFVLHFRMTGKVVPGVRAARARWHLDDGFVVSFVDPRRLGEVRYLQRGALDAHFARLGPEPWPERRSGEFWRAQLGGLRGPLKPALLRQDRVAGVGNITAAEVLWRARLDPCAFAASVLLPEWERLAAGAHAYFDDSVAGEAGDEIHFVSEGGRNPFSVYRREGEPCPRCGAPIARFAQAGRSTWWCPPCQAAPGAELSRPRS